MNIFKDELLLREEHVLTNASFYLPGRIVPVISALRKMTSFWRFLILPKNYKQLDVIGRFLIQVCIPLSLSISLHFCKQKPASIQHSKPSAIPGVILSASPTAWVTGNFDGDADIDSVSLQFRSGLSPAPLTQVPDPMNNEWDSVVVWYPKNNVTAVLSMNTHPDSTLDLGPSKGVYVLLNLGDLNRDGKDELAVVSDYLDYSSLNTCNIYSFCGESWCLQKSFSISENYFVVVRGDSMRGQGLEAFLRREGDHWMYSDYLENLNDSLNRKNFRRLKVPACRPIR